MSEALKKELEDLLKKHGMTGDVKPVFTDKLFSGVTVEAYPRTSQDEVTTIMRDRVMKEAMELPDKIKEMGGLDVLIVIGCHVDEDKSKNKTMELVVVEGSNLPIAIGGLESVRDRLIDNLKEISLKMLLTKLFGRDKQ